MITYSTRSVYNIFKKEHHRIVNEYLQQASSGTLWDQNDIINIKEDMTKIEALFM